MTDAVLPRVKPDARILIVEDDSDSARFFATLMKSEGFEQTTCSTGEEALARLADSPDFDLILLDLLLPGMSGWEVLKTIKSDGKLRYVPVVVLSSLSDKDNFLQALDLGAEDFLTKPVDVETLISRVRVMLRIRNLYEELADARFGRQQAQRTLQMQRYLAKMMGGSTQVQELADVLDQVVATDTTVLMEGESGTGKSLLAEVIHRFSKRSKGPFVVVNCSAYPETLLASELFGHEKGAFTGAIKRKAGRFELAAGGTVFLDEVAEISQLTQLSLLRVIQDRQFERVGGEKTLTADVRILAATNKKLEKQVELGLFREDLYYRLNVVKLDIPPLRLRQDDIPFLASNFLRAQRDALNKPIYGFTHNALARLMNYSWPGNVRELRNVVEHAALMCRGEVIDLADLPPRLDAAAEQDAAQPTGDGRLRDSERVIVDNALTKTGWNKYQAAKMLGISRSTLYSKIKKYGLKPAEESA